MLWNTNLQYFNVRNHLRFFYKNKCSYNLVHLQLHSPAPITLYQ